MWLTELEISHFIIKGFPVFVHKMAWDMCLHSLSMRPYRRFWRSQINTPEIISKYQRITPNTRFAHIPFRSGRKAWCVGVISQRQINIPGIIFIIRPFEKRTYYAVAKSVRPSVRLSVRPSVRVFRTFLQHALRYQFETWYIHLVGGTTCRVRVASQLGHFDLVYSQK